MTSSDQLLVLLFTQYGLSSYSRSLVFPTACAGCCSRIGTVHKEPSIQSWTSSTDTPSSKLLVLGSVLTALADLGGS